VGYYLPGNRPIRNEDFGSALAKIRQQLKEFELAKPCYAAVCLSKDGLDAVVAGEALRVSHQHPQKHLLNWLKNYQQQHSLKVIALALSGRGELEKIGSRLWLELDIVPVLGLDQKLTLPEQAAQLASEFSQDGVAGLNVDEHQEVHPSFLVTAEDHQQITNGKVWQKLLDLKKQFGNKNLLFISATPRGGGVALMRHALIRFYRLLGINAHWHTLIENSEAFEITKGKFHNVLQAVTENGVGLTDEDKEFFEQWSQENFNLLTPAIKKADVIVIDDPQPSGLIPGIKAINPQAKLLYRSHIQIESHLIDKKDSPQAKTWNYLWQFIKEAETFVAHPVDDFIPSSVPRDIVFQMPPTTDPLDGLNKPLSETDFDYYLTLFNRILLNHHQAPLDKDRPYLIQIARFDPAKGIPDTIESYRLLREKLAEQVKSGKLKEQDIPQLVLVGHGSIDDPDGGPLFQLTERVLRLSLYSHLADDIKIARLPHSDQLLNALLRKAKIALQLSHKEGFEVKVTEALMKGKPVIAYRAGGIPLQIAADENGFVIDPVGDCQQVAEKLFELLTDDKLYQRLSQAAEAKARRDVLTLSNAINWLKLGLD
jgi:glycosyltransferase involved in cell wall biosynthesis